MSGPAGSDGAMHDPLDAIFGALADPTRRAILALLLEDDMAVSDVAAPFGSSLAAISKHLIVLDRAGLISRERRGRITWCRLEPAGLGVAATWIEAYGGWSREDMEAVARLLRALGLEDELHDGEDDHDQPHEIDDGAHGSLHDA